VIDPRDSFVVMLRCGLNRHLINCPATRRCHHTAWPLHGVQLHCRGVGSTDNVESSLNWTM